MNKQQLANKIWSAANKMRSKIEANEYKDYILGFIFYRFLSEKEEKWLLEQEFSEEDIKALAEEDGDTREFIQDNLGYFISYKYLFSTWIDQKQKFDVSYVRDGLSAFERLISTNHKKVYSRIFNTLGAGLSKLGDSAGSQTKAISELLNLIKDIPMNERQNYDVLGFIYEYLISMFAANAGKKAGEFYTPHEAAMLMSEIVAEHLKEKSEVQIYDPTSGSGSLLITIGKAMSKYMDPEKIKYYAQEIKENTYNLTRMNLVMRGIEASNIVVRNGDTLEDDWPYFDESDKERTYDPLYVDAVVSNPPYSQSWRPENKDSNPRFGDYGLAPKGKADFAFLLHDLYHIKPDGIMTIVLPHGVLFRGNEEAVIRKKLIEKNKIDAIIGLPANAFFGTSIPTLIMVLKQERENTDVLIIDASKYYVKADKKNKLQASDIKRIMDAIKFRKTIPGYCTVVSKETIRANDYNLNIPRYVDSAELTETLDIYASMFGGIPKAELDTFAEYWQIFPSLYNELFTISDTPYTELKAENLRETLSNNTDVITFQKKYESNFQSFRAYLKQELFSDVENINISSEETRLGDNVFERLRNIELVDKYKAYQILDDSWQETATDLEVITTEGFGATRIVEPNMVIKKKDGQDVEVQEGWKGRVLPFVLVQKLYFADELEEIAEAETHINELEQECNELIESLEEDDREKITNDDGDKLDNKKVKDEAKRIFEEDIESPELAELQAYIAFLDAKPKKAEKEKYIAEHTAVKWSNMTSAKDGTYGKSAVTSYIKALKEKFVFSEGSYEYYVMSIATNLEVSKQARAELKELQNKLEEETKKFIETQITDEEIYTVLEAKWITPLVDNISTLPEDLLANFADKLSILAEKYKVTYQHIAEDINIAENEIVQMIDELTGDNYDMQGLQEFQKSLRGEKDE